MSRMMNVGRPDKSVSNKLKVLTRNCNGISVIPLCWGVTVVVIADPSVQIESLWDSLQSTSR